jgi:hypothetical protein
MRSVSKHWVVRSGSLRIVIDSYMLAPYVAQIELESGGEVSGNVLLCGGTVYKVHSKIGVLETIRWRSFLVMKVKTLNTTF